MSTAWPHTPAPPHTSAPPPHPPVRRAAHADAEALYTLSHPFFLSGALRERPPSLYATEAPGFLVVDHPDGTLDGCLGLRTYPPASEGSGDPCGVLYNFCVSARSQGRGVGSALLCAALTEAAARSMHAVFTATSGGGRLFLRHGFTHAPIRLAPPAWADALDPRRGSRVLSKRVRGVSSIAGRA
ncbi:GNAT family N-acetyltransferase [Streptomyces sp. NPDC055078]